MLNERVRRAAGGVLSHTHRGVQLSVRRGEELKLHKKQRNPKSKVPNVEISYRDDTP